MTAITKRERVQATLRGELTDRPPTRLLASFPSTWVSTSVGGGDPRLLRPLRSRHLKVMPDLPYPFPRDSVTSLDDGTAWRRSPSSRQFRPPRSTSCGVCAPSWALMSHSCARFSRRSPRP